MLLDSLPPGPVATTLELSEPQKPADNKLSQTAAGAAASCAVLAKSDQRHLTVQ
jgi:hypothetical protein